MGNLLCDVNIIVSDIWRHWYTIRSSIFLRSMQILVIISGGLYKASVLFFYSSYDRKGGNNYDKNGW